MSNVVLIPCWRREDFLQVTLDCIKEAQGADKNIYVFLVDRGFHSEVVEVAKAFPLEKIIRFTPQHRFYGNSYNLLEGYRFGHKLLNERKGELVYLIEEDIWVGKDFFTFHEKVQSKYPCFGLSAVRNQNNQTPYPPEPESVYHHIAYQSLGVSFKASTLEKILPHARPEFYRSMQRYVIANFRDSRYGSGWTEQDGLINRIAEKSPVHMLYPFVPRAFHAGFVGYNRKGKPLQGNLQERVAKLKAMSDQEMNELAAEYKDITRCHLEGYEVQDFVLKQQ